MGRRNGSVLNNVGGIAVTTVCLNQCINQPRVVSVDVSNIDTSNSIK